ncbi:hypothetical protein EJB05_14710, partial [Eragrostis curvula]
MSTYAHPLSSIGFTTRHHLGARFLLHCTLCHPSIRVKFEMLATKREPIWIVTTNVGCHDVSIDGLLGHDMRDVNLNYNLPILATQTESTLLPSGCLIEDMNNGYCKLFFSGQAFGACGWLTSLRSQCEYVTASHVRDAPACINIVTMSAKGKRGIWRYPEDDGKLLCSRLWDH